MISKRFLKVCLTMKQTYDTHDIETISKQKDKFSLADRCHDRRRLGNEGSRRHSRSGSYA